MIRVLPLFLALSVAALAEDQRGFPASDVTWQSVFGHRDADKDTLYSMMGCGFEAAPLSKDLDAVVKGWISAHPSARVVPIATYHFANDKGTYDRTWVWLIDGEDNLASELIRKGCCPAGIMSVPGGKPLVPEAEYGAFLDLAKKAEEEARQQHLGIWSAGADEEMIEKAEGLKEQHKYKEAIEAYHAAMEKGADAESCWTAIGDCQESMGEYQAALSAYDRAIEQGSLGPIAARAHCMSRYEGPAVADAWLASLIERKATGDEKADLHLVRGDFHLEEKRPKEALASFSACIKLRADAQGFKFGEDGMLVMDEPTSTKQEAAYMGLWTPLEFAARCCLDLKDLDGAFRYATMGVSVHQQSRRCSGRYSQDEVEAADVRCRLIRASVMVARKQLDEASKEVEMARRLAGDAGEEKDAVDLVRRAIEEAKKK